MNIYQRVNEVRKAVAYLKKDANVNNRYKAISHDFVTASVRANLIEQGILIVPNVQSSEVVATDMKTKSGTPIIRYQARYEVRFVNCDEPTEFIPVEMDAHALDEGDKAPGKAVSYATKNAMLKLFSLETGEDDESRVRPGMAEDDLAAHLRTMENSTDEKALKQAYSEAFKAADGDKHALDIIMKAKDAQKAKLKEGATA